LIWPTRKLLLLIWEKMLDYGRTEWAYVTRPGQHSQETLEENCLLKVKICVVQHKFWPSKGSFLLVKRKGILSRRSRAADAASRCLLGWMAGTQIGPNGPIQRFLVSTSLSWLPCLHAPPSSVVWPRSAQGCTSAAPGSRVLGVCRVCPGWVGVWFSFRQAACGWCVCTFPLQ